VPTHDIHGRIAERSARVAVLGQGYVGLVVAMRASEAGFPVVGLEVDERRAARLQAGDSFIEDVPDEVLDAALGRGYRATSDEADLAGFDVAVISVPTPLREGLPDLSFIETASRMLARHLRPETLVVLESTTYPGTTVEVVQPILESTGLVAGRDFLLGYSPERIDPGNPSWSLANTPKIVAGIDGPSLAAVEAFFGAFVEKTIPVSGPGEAELAKIIENTFRHVNIALVNEIAMFAHDLGIDAFEAIEAAASKPFGFMKFTPGPGVGGHCLPIDPSYLSWRVKTHLGENFRFIELANDVNEHMPAYVSRRVQALLNRDRLAVNGARVLVLGLAYKPNVGDWREAPSLHLIEQLVSLGAEVTAVDPHVDPADDLPLPASVSVRTELTREHLEQADVAVIVTDHDDVDYELVLSASHRVLDTRNRLPRDDGRVEHL
jgi:UDP-N-acetyl-D-glucosamine dehydrogenase